MSTPSPTKWPWFERQFSFNFPPEKMPDILERLRGTPSRAAALVEGRTEHLLGWREQAGTWSIKENLAHIADLEPLWMGRVEDVRAGIATMREADLSNTATNQAEHNRKPIDDILAAVKDCRTSFVELIDGLSADEYGRAAQHPRLKQPMRIVDLCLFVAEHDDYHLARSRYLCRAYGD